MSKEDLLSRAVCCGLNCLECPYKPRHKKGSTNIMPEEYRAMFKYIQEQEIAMEVIKKLLNEK